MRSTYYLALTLVLPVLFGGQNAWAQGTRVGTNQIGETTGGGLQQTGQLQSENAINRNFAVQSAAAAGGIGGIGGIGGLGGFGGGRGGFGGGGFGGGGFGGGGFGGGGFGSGGFGGGGFNQNTQQKLFRAPIRLGFTHPARPVAQVAAKFQTRLTKLPGFAKHGNVTVVVEGKKAVLKGTVRTARHRDLARRLALLEPGIYEIQNELVILESSSTSSETAR